jgi:hypothetical protein
LPLRTFVKRGTVRTHDVADALRAADRVVDRRHAKRLGERHEPVDVVRGRFAVVYAKRNASSSSLHGHDDPPAAAAPRRRLAKHAEPIRRSLLGRLAAADEDGHYCFAVAL